ncbi:MAG: hypothetical protein M1816_001892 [Peltula sp. TS41687]|nr:MAG: hypothetical protein M1816_001892 [Peltula sp. TS41687]
MLNDVVVPLGPSALNSLTWSEDYHLALAGGEHIQLLVPRFPASKRSEKSSQTSATAQWDLVQFRINSFSPQEVPPIWPANSLGATIGEAQSMCHAISIAWSPAGPARHRRCLLGVLTANYILSLWESEGDPNEPLGWRRCMIVNNELKRDSLQQEEDQEEEYDVPPEIIRLRRRKNRINSFGWSHSCHLDARERWGVHLLATTDDCNEIFIARVTSSYDLLAPAQDYLTLDLLAQINLEEDLNGCTDPSAAVKTARRKINNTRRTVRGLAWGPWIESTDECRHSLLACAVQGEVYIVKIHVTSVEDSSAYSTSAPRISAEIGGDIFALDVPHRRSIAQLRWHDKVHQGWLVLANATSETVIIVFIRASSCMSGSESQRSVDICALKEDTHDVRIRKVALPSWTPISAMSFFLDESKDELTLYTSTLDSQYKIYRCSPDAGTTRSPRDHTLSIQEFSSTNHSSKTLQLWHEGLAVKLSNFDFKHGLKNSALMKTWGLTSSSMSSWIAACISFHPSNLPEYVISSRERSIITFACQNSVVLNRCRSASEIAQYSQEVLLFEMRLMHGLLRDALSDKLLQWKNELANDKITDNLKDEVQSLRER